jgi:hypothetical protein
MQNFYIVIATINPIFFLALTIQGSFYGSLIERINSVVIDATRATEEKRIITWKESARGWLVVGILPLATAILVAGIGGEITALATLYFQLADNFIQSFVFSSTVGVILLTAVTPGWSLARAVYKYEVAGIRNFVFVQGIRRDDVKKLEGYSSNQSQSLRSTVVHGHLTIQTCPAASPQVKRDRPASMLIAYSSGVGNSPSSPSRQP